jgi:hypothetical protein
VREYLTAMDTRALRRLLRDSRKALELAEPHEAVDLRARNVADANRKMIPTVEAILADRN